MLSLAARRLCRLLSVTLALVGAIAAPLHAQVSETPVAFDTAGGVRTLTPPLVSRFALAAPTWPVHDDFVEARLFAVSDGAFVLAVQRQDGRVDRYSLTAAQASDLRAAVTAAMQRVGRAAMEEGPATISEPAGGAFVRNQMFASALIYGPAAASLTHDGSAGTAVYLLAVGGSYFALTGLSQSTTITKSQNDLATDGSVRGALMLLGGASALGADVKGDAAAALTLAGGIGGSVAGYMIGKGLTQAEARSMRAGSTLLGLTTLGVGMSTGAVHDNGRLAAGLSVLGGAVGYALGPSYPRRASYTITAGDVDMVEVAAILGGMTAAVPIADVKNVSDQAIGATVTAGLIAGTIIGDRAFARPYNHTVSEASRIELGTFAGMLMGAAIPAAAQSGDAALILGSMSLGGILGTMAAESLVAPRPAGAPQRASGDGARLHLDPAALALTMTRQRGVHPLVSIAF